MKALMGEKMNLALAVEGRIQPARPKTKQLVKIAGALAALPDPDIDVTFMKALEHRLLTEVVEVRRLSSVPATPADEVVRRAPIIRIPSGRFTLRRGFAAGLAAAALGAFPVAAAAQALPGSPFYSLKTGMEKAQIAFFGGPVEDGFAKMAHAQRRVSEAQQVTALGGDTETVASLLAIANDLSREGGNLVLTNTTDPAQLQRLASIAEETEARLRAEAAALGTTAAAEFEAVLSTTASIQDAVAAALGVSGTAMPALPELVAPAAGTSDVAPVSGGAPGTFSEPSESTRSTEERQGPVAPDENGGVKDITGGEGCEIPLENEAGDLLAPIAREMCK